MDTEESDVSFDSQELQEKRTHTDCFESELFRPRRRSSTPRSTARRGHATLLRMRSKPICYVCILTRFLFIFFLLIRYVRSVLARTPFSCLLLAQNAEMPWRSFAILSLAEEMTLEKEYEARQI